MDREGCGHGLARGNISKGNIVRGNKKKETRIPENFHSDWRVRV